MSELAIQNGVPEFRLCSGLNWQREANFYWVRESSADYMGQPCILGYEKWELFHKKDISESMAWGGFHEIKAAPQIHQLLEAFPSMIEDYSLCIYKDMDCIYRVAYEKKNGDRVPSLNEYFTDTNLANAIVQMYMCLKKQNLLNS